MHKPSPKCIILLSDKSSGSSALQQEFARHPEVRYVARTPHNEHETLYWIKAVALLGLPQADMRYSRVVPYESSEARRALLHLITSNAPAFESPRDDEALVFRGWRALCEAHASVFFEKSPHHLHQWPALELMARGVDELPDVRFYFIGLVRNPMDTLYSMWSRWRYVPEKRQHEWVRAYSNLLRFRSLAGDALTVVRYEDVVADPNKLQNLFAFCGLAERPALCSQLHRDAVQKWKVDARFGFQPSRALVDLAGEFGYEPSALTNRRRPLWPAYRTAKRAVRSGRQALARLRRR